MPEAALEYFMPEASRPSRWSEHQMIIVSTMKINNREEEEKTIGQDNILRSAVEDIPP